MEHEYLFEQDELEATLREKVEENPNCSFLCPECGSFHIYQVGINAFGNITYLCDDCGYIMTANEIICE